MALGVESETPYEERSLTLNPGDFLVLYTDGVTDALNLEGRFRESLERARHLMGFKETPRERAGEFR